jgi:5-carboxymethyl-2-hydroxymuconate isomerase
MPQLTLEYSSNIIEKTNLVSLLKSCHELIASELPANIASCKSRAMERDVYCVGDGNLQNAFVHLTLNVLPGRDEAARTRVGEKLLALLKDYFSRSLASLQLQITVELDELPKTYFKFAK